eukprot:TRINITY_DN12755_c0_g1_i1.p1 TRINITY_DN12755_c0_g1~~TRINITY_DN12755_c0_g1_i1.p1  ORF type:complete len:151 (-),score=39.92 TRINITY_DN12755_c0_g1_i1:148-537(-)
MFVQLLVVCCVGGSLAKPQSSEPQNLMDIPQITNVEQVVDSVSRIAMSLETSASNNQARFTRQAPPALMPYRYGYAVQDDVGNDFNQQEQSDGQVITGQYSVLLPDGRVQTVTYSVAPNTGFVAEVTYS